VIHQRTVVDRRPFVLDGLGEQLVFPFTFSPLKWISLKIERKNNTHNIIHFYKKIFSVFSGVCANYGSQDDPNGSHRSGQLRGTERKLDRHQCRRFRRILLPDQWSYHFGIHHPVLLPSPV
jgi:hypothetical protein